VFPEFNVLVTFTSVNFYLVALLPSLRNVLTLQHSFRMCELKARCNYCRFAVDVKINPFATYLLTHSMVQAICRADCHSACQKISCFLMEPEGSLPCSHKPSTGLYAEPTESSSPHLSLSP